MRRPLIGLALGVTLAGHASAASFTHFTTKDGREVVVLSGEIAPGDAEQLGGLIRATNADGRLVSGLRLNSFGGNLMEGAKVADVVREAKIASVVANGASCASACFIVFAAGGEKYVSYAANVGVHGASIGGGQETTESRAATVAMAKMVKELGVPSSIIGQMVVTPPDKIVWLAPADLVSMGATMTGKPTQAAPGPIAPIPDQAPPLPLSGQQSVAAAGALPAQNDREALWKQVVDTAISESGKQNSGTPALNRACQPELKICNTAVFFRNAKGLSTMVRIGEDISGKIVSRSVCTFNAFGDTRECLNWETGTSSQEMKNGAGNWIVINSP